MLLHQNTLALCECLQSSTYANYCVPDVLARVTGVLLFRLLLRNSPWISLPHPLPSSSAQHENIPSIPAPSLSMGPVGLHTFLCSSPFMHPLILQSRSSMVILNGLHSRDDVLMISQRAFPDDGHWTLMVALVPVTIFFPPHPNYQPRHLIYQFSLFADERSSMFMLANKKFEIWWANAVS